MTLLRVRKLEEQDISNFNTLPATESCRLIDFEEWAIVPGYVNDTWFLVVSGTKPWSQMRVSLNPFIYISRPEYWAIEVVGCLDGYANPVEVKYVKTIEVTHLFGKKGIELIGASRSEKFDSPS